MQEANKAARDVVWLLNNFINLFRNYTEINYTMQNIKYLKIGSIFPTMLLKALNTFFFFFKLKITILEQVAIWCLGLLCHIAECVTEITNRANRRGLAASADIRHSSPQTKEIPTGGRICSSLGMSSLKTRWVRSYCSICSHLYPDSVVSS